MLLSKCKKTEIVPTFVESAEYLSLVWVFVQSFFDLLTKRF